jgi:hypothetical protein
LLLARAAVASLSFSLRSYCGFYKKLTQLTELKAQSQQPAARSQKLPLAVFCFLFCWLVASWSWSSVAIAMRPTKSQKARRRPSAPAPLRLRERRGGGRARALQPRAAESLGTRAATRTTGWAVLAPGCEMPDSDHPRSAREPLQLPQPRQSTV